MVINAKVKLGEGGCVQSRDAETSIFIHPELLKPCTFDQSIKPLTFSHRYCRPVPRSYVKRL